MVASDIEKSSLPCCIFCTKQVPSLTRVMRAIEANQEKCDACHDLEQDRRTIAMD